MVEIHHTMWKKIIKGLDINRFLREQHRMVIISDFGTQFEKLFKQISSLYAWIRQNRNLMVYEC